MTPLARELANQLTLPVRKRIEPWRSASDDLCKLLEDIHCFECTAAIPLAEELRKTLSQSDTAEETADAYFAKLCFLPAPRTWVEWDSAFLNCRIGVHLMENPDDDDEALAIMVYRNMACPLGAISLTSGDVTFPGGKLALPDSAAELVQSGGLNATRVALSLLATVQFLLTIINTPKVIGRRQHMPHRALQRDLIQKFGVGKFPLHAWTEIKLNVFKPIEIDDGEPHEAHLTGRRALHFCRAHLRIRRGQLEYVTSHWRGDPAIGIKRSRYALTAA